MERRKEKIGEGNTKKREFLEKVQVSYPKRGGKNANASFLSVTFGRYNYIWCEHLYYIWYKYVDIF